MTRLGLAALVAVLAACGGVGAGRGGISQQQAIAIARSQAQAISETPVVLVSATSGQLGSFVAEPPTALGGATRHAWAIVFSGTFQGSCGPAPVPPSSSHACPAPNGSVRVILDMASNSFLLAETPAGSASVHITRAPGLFLLTLLDRTITDFATVTRLANDVLQLPPFPGGAHSCPADFGTSYTLSFSIVGEGRWTATIDVSGCRGVAVSNGPTRWALNAPSLFVDLAAALRLTQDELVPQPCPAPAGVHCYPQPNP